MNIARPAASDIANDPPVGSVRPGLSVVIAVSKRFDDIGRIHRAYRRGLEATGLEAEFIYVLDGPLPAVAAELLSLRKADEPIRVLRLPRSFGESSALTVAFDQCAGALVLILPPYLQVDPDYLPLLFESIETADMVIAARDRRGDSIVNRLRGRVFRHIARASGSRFADLGCEVRLFRAEIACALSLYGEQHRFLPVLAEHQGFRVSQVTLPQHPDNQKTRWNHPFTFVERMLDVGALFFVLRFTRKPFRFFGSLGLLIGAAGFVVGIAVSMQKLAYNLPLADRPSLILSVLLIVLGVQITAVGLIAEIVVFTRLKTSDDLLIAEIVQADPDPVLAE